MKENVNKNALKCRYFRKCRSRRHAVEKFGSPGNVCLMTE